MPNVMKFSSLSGHVVRGDRCLKDYGFRLSQAVDSAEVSYAMALLPSFFFSAAFDSNWYAGGTKMYFSFVRIWLGRKLKQLTKLSRSLKKNFSIRRQLILLRIFEYIQCRITNFSHCDSFALLDLI